MNRDFYPSILIKSLHLKEGKYADTDNPPEVLSTEEMRQAMKVLRKFSESEADYLLYQSRLDAILTHNTWLRQMEEAQKQTEQARKQTEQAQKEKEKIEKKFKKLLLLLKKKGIDADDILNQD